MTTGLQSIPPPATEDLPALFGTPQRTAVLAIIGAVGETFPREIARIADLPLITVQRIVKKLELERIVVTRLIGRQRRVTLNPDLAGATKLQDLLETLAEGSPAFRARLGRAARRRPRRGGKPI